MINRTKLTELLRQRQPNRRPRKRRGQALIEMALVMTVLLTLTFGLVDFGMFLTSYIRATNCAREVARSAVVHTANAKDLCNAQDLVMLENVTITVNPDPWVGKKRGTPVTVTVQGEYRWVALAPILNAFFPGSAMAETIMTTHKTTMYMEGTFAT